MTAAPFPGLIADAERMVSAFLRESPEVVALVGDRVYTAFPANAGNGPLVIVQRFGGSPPFSQPLVLDEAELQVDAYGGSKVVAHELVATVRAVLSTLEGLARPEGVCSAVRFGALQWRPDETFTPSRPRYVADVTVHVRARPLEPTRKVAA